MVDKKECYKIYEPLAERAPYIFKDGKWEGDQVCSLGNGVYSCQGDSGGGLIANIIETNVIIG